jgi:hypothetical protein
VCDLPGRVQRAVPAVTDAVPVRGISGSFSLALLARLGRETGREHMPHLQYRVILGRTRGSGDCANDAYDRLGLNSAKLSGLLRAAAEKLGALERALRSQINSCDPDVAKI